MRSVGAVTAILLGMLASPALAQPATPFAEPPLVLNSGDTAWMLAASALALLVALPGLALLHAGAARARNALAAIVPCFAIAGAVSLIWIAIGYSLVYAPGSAMIGGLDLAMLGGLGIVYPGTTVPESAFVLFQMALAVIAPVIVVGALVDRARLGWLVGFASLWSLIVYVPIARWMWGGGWLAGLGASDFAGGIVVHLAAGMSALVVAAMAGRRRGFLEATPEHAPALRLAGAGMVWAGWFGVVGGASLAAAEGASSAIITLHAGVCAAILVWMLFERLAKGFVTAGGVAGGMLAGIAAMSGAAGAVGPAGAMLIGAAAAMLAFMLAGLIRRMGIDDPGRVFASHGVAGGAGAVLVAMFALPALGGLGYADGASMASQLVGQIVGVLIVALWATVASAAIAWVVGLVLPMRAREADGDEGIDMAAHGGRAWDLD